MRDEPAEEREVRRHALDDRLVESVGEQVERCVAIGGVCDELRDHRVVRRADLVALGDAGVDADRTPGARAALIRPACGRNVRGSSA